MIEYCRCNCHQDDSKRHCVPCCSPCNYCGRNVKIGFMETHVKSCITYDAEKEKINVQKSLKDWLKSKDIDKGKSKQAEDFFSEYQ